MGNFLVSWLKCLISTLLPLSWIMKKAFLPYVHVESISLFRQSSRQWNAIFYYNQTSFESKKYLYFCLTQCSWDQQTYIFFYFSMLQPIDEPQYCFSAISQPMSHFYVFFSHCDVILSRTLTTFSSKYLLLTDWEIPCITILFYLLYWSALLILMSLFIRASSNRQTWLSVLPTRFCNNETSCFKLWMISTSLFSNFTVIALLGNVIHNCNL